MITYAIFGAIVVVVAVVLIGVSVALFYKTPRRHEALVRTGWKGFTVVMDGGMIVIPGLQQYSRVNIGTHRLLVEQKERHAFSTLDCLRADIVAQFFVRIDNTKEGVRMAAQTLGEDINNEEVIRDLIEPKLIGALRAVSAKTNMDGLHKERDQFTKEVQDHLGEDLGSNGLKLESVQLTSFNQTKIEFYDPDNVFDSQGMTAITERTENNKRTINDTVQTNKVAIATRDRDASKQQDDIAVEVAQSNLERDLEIANRTADTEGRKAAAEEAARLAREQAIIETNERIFERTQAANQANRTKEIETERTIEIANQERNINIARKTEETAQAEAAAAEAAAKLVQAEELVVTAREKSIAERARDIRVIKAQEEAQSEAVSVTVHAQAEKQAAEDRASAITIAARSEKEAAVLRAEGSKAEGEAKAEVERMLNEARNTLDPKLIDLETLRVRMEALPGTVEAMMKPVEKISEIRIFDTSGFGRGSLGTSSDGAGYGTPGQFADQLVNFTGNREIMSSMLSMAGLSSTDPNRPVTGLLGSLVGDATQPSDAQGANDDPLGAADTLSDPIPAKAATERAETRRTRNGAKA